MNLHYIKINYNLNILIVKIHILNLSSWEIVSAIQKLLRYDLIEME